MAGKDAQIKGKDCRGAFLWKVGTHLLPPANRSQDRLSMSKDHMKSQFNLQLERRRKSKFENAEAVSGDICWFRIVYRNLVEIIDTDHWFRFGIV